MVKRPNASIFLKKKWNSGTDYVILQYFHKHRSDTKKANEVTGKRIVLKLDCSSFSQSLKEMLNVLWLLLFFSINIFFRVKLARVFILNSVQLLTFRKNLSWQRRSSKNSSNKLVGLIRFLFRSKISALQNICKREEGITTNGNNKV